MASISLKLSPLPALQKLDNQREKILSKALRKYLVKLQGQLLGWQLIGVNKPGTGQLLLTL